MQSNSEILSSMEYRPKHVSLTHFLRHNWRRDAFLLNAILSKCTVAPYIGVLPVDLRDRVPKQELGAVTYEFRMRLEDFLIDNFYDILDASDALHYRVDQIGDLFKTQCNLDFGGVNDNGSRKWSGLFSVVGKLSFPELHAEYALKVFNGKNSSGEHGATFEIPTAFAAAHAEPRDNSRVYMASLIYHPYMLSMWEGDVADGHIRKNENEIFTTYDYEAESRNYRGGRRIDYGETYRTAYGAVGYKVRKMCRKIKYAANRVDIDGLRQMAQDASVAAPAARNDFEKAMNLASCMMSVDIYEMIRYSKNY